MEQQRGQDYAERHEDNEFTVWEDRHVMVAVVAPMQG